jgi:hypothetical protein
MAIPVCQNYIIEENKDTAHLGGGEPREIRGSHGDDYLLECNAV